MPGRPSSTRVFRNDWSRLKPPPLGGWTPTRSVSVIIPAYNCQSNLELVLAALSRQTYPAELLEVVIADDGSTPPLTLPEVRPKNCTIVRVPDISAGWGRSNALHTGAVHSSGEILHWLDSDMVVFPEHVEAQARWHHIAPDLVILGYKRFVNEGTLTPTEVLRHIDNATLGQAFPPEVTGAHDYVEELIDKTNKLRAGDHLNFRAHVGATASLSREFYVSTGGLNCDLRLGEDTEFGFRLTQAGALFIPEPAAKSWHMGPSNMMRTGEALRRYNRPYLADLMPHPRWLRQGAQRSWQVPLVTAVVEAAGSAELVTGCVDRLLASDEHDLAVYLVGPWDKLPDDRRSILGDPELDLRLIEATYRSEPRVQLVTTKPASIYPSPYRLDLPATVGVGLTTVRRLVAEADRWRAGLLRAVPSKRSPEDPALELWRTAAVARAGRHAQPNESLVDAVGEMHGQRWVSGADFDITDLSEFSPEELASPRPRYGSGEQSTTGPVLVGDTEDLVIVGGLRSLMRATSMVAKQSVRRIRDR